MKYFISYTNPDGTSDSIIASSKDDLADTLRWLKSIGAEISYVGEVIE